MRSSIFTAPILGRTLHIQRGTAFVLNARQPPTVCRRKLLVGVIDCTQVMMCQSIQFSKQPTKKKAITAVLPGNSGNGKGSYMTGKIGTKIKQFSFFRQAKKNPGVYLGQIIFKKWPKQAV